MAGGASTGFPMQITVPLAEHTSNFDDGALRKPFRSQVPLADLDIFRFTHAPASVGTRSQLPCAASAVDTGKGKPPRIVKPRKLWLCGLSWQITTAHCAVSG